MLSDFSRDLADPDQPVKDAAAERPGAPIKIRVQPAILRRNGQYKGWADVRWTLDCDSPAEALAVRDAMQLFFETLSRVGPKRVGKLLTEAKDSVAATAAMERRA